MKNLIFTASFLYIICFSSNLLSQSGWQVQQAFLYYTDVFFVSGTPYGYMVGELGLIRKTTNNGDSWNWINSGFTRSLNSVYFINPNTGWVAGDSGKILKTSNGGISWSQQTTNTNLKINSIKFLDQNVGWCVGEDALCKKTTNGGFAWTDIFVGYGQDLNQIFFLNPSIYWIVGNYGELHKTTNAGSNWFSQNPGTIANLYDISFINTNNGFIAADSGVILSTPFGGTVWFRQVIGNGSLKSLAFVDSTNGWVCGMNGNLYKTTNSGVNWISQNLGNEDCLESIKFINPSTGWVVEDCNNSSTFFKSTNGGTNWIAQEQGAYGSFYAVDFINQNIGWAFSNPYGVAKTTNGGISWFYSYYLIDNFLDGDFVDEHTGWVIGYESIKKSTDGGYTWATQDSMFFNLLQGIFFLNSSTGWVVGSSGLIKKTTNSGVVWSYQTNGVSGNLKAIYFTDVNTGWAVGSKILMTTNGGELWFQTYPTSNINFNSIYSSGSTVYASGNSNLEGYLFKSTDYGVSWTEISHLSFPSLINGISFINSNTGWLVGTNIYKTTNGGLNLILQLSPINFVYNDVIFINSLQGWVVSDAGIILNTNTGGEIGIKKINEIIPSIFSLSQNYPNPFNPVTKIKFEIPAVGQRHAFDVRLIIYDILGREIQTLVNENKKPGTYEVDWDGSRFSSGVYLYRLVTDDASAPLSITKKMVLIK